MSNKGNTAKGGHRNGGTPKGVSKPHRRKKRVGSDERWLKQDGFGDVGQACARWIDGRVRAGLMKPVMRRIYDNDK